HGTLGWTRLALVALAVTFAPALGGCAADTEEDDYALEDDGDELAFDDESEAAGEVESAASAAAPSCVTAVRRRAPFDAWWVRNGCRTSQRVGLDIRWRQDPPCITLRPGEERAIMTAHPNRFRKVKRC